MATTQSQQSRRAWTQGAAPEGWETFGVRTLDDVAIAGVTLPSPDTDTAVVLSHGFLGSWRRPQNVDLARALARRFAVFLFDFRGHGDSDGLSTVGDREALDVHAVVGAAHERYARVVTVGASMGAIASLREAGRFGDVDAVVSISAPGRWAGQGTIARMSGVVVTTRAGRRFARRVLGTRVSPTWRWTPPPAEIVESIHVPLLIVHGTGDRFIAPAQAELLYAKANDPRKLFVLDGFGHAELGYTPAFADLLGAELEAMRDADWGAGASGRLGWADAGRPAPVVHRATT